MRILTTILCMTAVLAGITSCPVLAQVCVPTADGLGCENVECPDVTHTCQPVCVNFDPSSGQTLVLDCECLATDSCHVNLPQQSSGCVVPDNGTGTADLPPAGCGYVDHEDDWMIIDGLPPGTTIEMDGILTDFVNIISGAGGSLGGEYQQFDATLELTVSGTGDLAGFNRYLFIPVTLETHSGPRTPGNPIQGFPADIYRMQGQLFGDPDFCEFMLIAGTDFGLPSPGHTTLRELPSGDFAVESFFDVTYQIQFEGCPGSQLMDYMGTTTATIRIEMGTFPICDGGCSEGHICEQIVTVNADNTFDICCYCEPLECEPNHDSSGCKTETCESPGDSCQPVCVQYDPTTGGNIVLNCDCLEPDICHVDLPHVSAGCIVPDNGAGTADLPPAGCGYVDPEDDWMIIDGLPPGTTIEMDGILTDFVNILSGAGGSLGGEYQQFDATLELTVSGTGDLAGFNRYLFIPVTLETHSGPRTPGNPIQSFPADIYQMQGQLFGDPDFCEFMLIAGTDFGLPSPGHTTLRELPSGDFAVESFFDVTYQIQFEGCPGSQLMDYMGTTTATIRIETGILPPCAGDCSPGETCEQLVTVNPDGTLDICCYCVTQVCEPNFDSSACKPGTCPDSAEACRPTCAQMDLTSGDVMVLNCTCQDTSLCYVDMTSIGGEPCLTPDNGSGTADLPPAGCEYVDPEEDWMIIDGLPPGTTIEMDGILTDFINITSGAGGTLGGEYEQFDATLELTVSGTGDLAGFSRHLAVPMAIETHSGPRTPGDPIQSFATDLYRMQGQLFGDPDFCDFMIRGGTDFGLPSPGHTILRELPSGDFAVESFFDVTYQIQFEGCPGSQLMDYMGTTTATIRIEMGATPPVCIGDCPPGETCERIVIDNGDGTLDICCACESACDCLPGDANGDGSINVGDAVYIISYVFKSGPPPTPYPICSGDANCDCASNVGDAVYLISYVFKGGPAPCGCGGWIGICGPPLRK